MGLTVHILDGLLWKWASSAKGLGDFFSGGFLFGLNGISTLGRQSSLLDRISLLLKLYETHGDIHVIRPWDTCLT